jgi:hypothetical protein
MGNNQICQNCEKLTTDNIIESKIKNKRQIVTLSYNGKLPNTHTDTVQTSISETAHLQIPKQFANFTGHGRVEYKPGWTYEGELIKGAREGIGRMTWPTGDYYEG